MTCGTFDLATRASAEIVNLALDKPAPEQYRMILRIVHETLRRALEERREAMLTPSDN